MEISRLSFNLSVGPEFKKAIYRNLTRPIYPSNLYGQALTQVVSDKSAQASEALGAWIL